MLQCSDRTIYTGITNNVKRRVAAHNAGKGARYTRGRTPVKLQATWIYKSRSAASKQEYVLKKLTRIEKLKLLRSSKKKRPRKRLKAKSK